MRADSRFELRGDSAMTHVSEPVVNAALRIHMVRISADSEFHGERVQDSFF